MLITPGLITYLLDHITALESLVNRQADLLMQYADEYDRLLAENKRMQAALIQARLNCQEIRV